MNASESELLAAVVANPADDAPRLAYADWLERAGPSPRAELIRLQCDIATKQQRVDALLTEHGREWAAPYDRRHVRVTAFRRGFPEEFRVGWPPRCFLDAADFLAATTPVAALEFPEIDDADLALVANSPACRNLTKLCIERGGFGEPGLRAVCRSPILKGLTELAIGSLDVGHAGIDSLVHAPFIKNLERLTVLGDQRIKSAGAFSKLVDALDHNVVRELNWFECVFDRDSRVFDRKTRPVTGSWTR